MREFQRVRHYLPNTVKLVNCNPKWARNVACMYMFDCKTSTEPSFSTAWWHVSMEQWSPTDPLSNPHKIHEYSGRKIIGSLGNVTIRGEKDGKSKGRARRPTVCVSMYSITENIYRSQLSSVAILLQPEPNCSTSYNTRKRLGSLSSCTIVLRSSPTSHVSTCNGQQSS
jgi:hypothetical protein